MRHPARHGVLGVAPQRYHSKPGGGAGSKETTCPHCFLSPLFSSSVLPLPPTARGPQPAAPFPLPTVPASSERRSSSPLEPFPRAPQAQPHLSEPPLSSPPPLQSWRPTLGRRYLSCQHSLHQAANGTSGQLRTGEGAGADVDGIKVGALAVQLSGFHLLCGPQTTHVLGTGGTDRAQGTAR